MDPATADRLSALPDAILVSILSLLKLQEAVRTSVLSSRWHHLWTYTSDLSLDAPNLLSPHLDRPLTHLYDLYKEPRDHLLSVQSQCFVRAAQRCLANHRAAWLRSFRLRFFLDNNDADLVNAWLDHVLSRGVEALELDLNRGRPVMSWASIVPYELPAHFFSSGRAASLKHLCLDFCSWSPPPKLGGLSSLTTLELRYVHISDEQLESLQSNCPRLERLVIANCPDLYYLEVFSSSIKYLRVEDWCSLETIELCATGLSVFEYRGHRLGLLFDKIQQLERVFLWLNSAGDVQYVLTRLPKEVPRLKTLILCFGSPREVMRYGLQLPQNPPVFTHLNRLAMSITSTGDLLWIGLLLEASPFLQKFDLHMICRLDMSRRRVVATPAESHHYHLKEVEMTGFTGDVHQIGFAKYIVANAVNLELMIIEPRPRQYVADDRWENVEAVFSEELERDWVTKRREWVYEQLLGEVKAGVQLVIK